MAEVRVAIVGVGNCASALIQGVEHYSKVGPSHKIPSAGLMTQDIGGFLPGDINFVAGFDVSEAKVGLDLSHAILAEPNNTRIFAEVPYKDVTVVAGSLLDGIGPSAASRVKTVSAEENVVEHLQATRADVVVNFLPVGSEMASRFYAEAALAAGCAFLNAIPTKIARNPDIADAYKDARLPLIGDDVKSQMGATIVHRLLTQAFGRRGIRLAQTYQLNVGGNLDFLNMKDQERLGSKRESKTVAVTSAANRGAGMEAGDVHIGPSDYVPWLEDRKVAMIRMEGEAFGGAPLTIDLRMEVWDSPNSAGVVIDGIRYLAGALRDGRSGVLGLESAWLMKAPPRQMEEGAVWEALQRVPGLEGWDGTYRPPVSDAGDAETTSHKEA